MLDLSAVRSAFPELRNLLFLAESGQKYVFRAEAKKQDVVLKIFRVGQEQERIDREIAAVAKLNCDYVPAVLESGQRSIGGAAWPFLIEEFVHGESYRSVLMRAPIQSLRSVLHLSDSLLRACCDFEAQQMVHRDIKPENLIIDVSGKVWVIDFGIVRLLDLKSATMTQQRFGLFTPGYGAPEQVRNIKSKIDVRADLFSIGVVLHESLSGSNPYIEGKRDALQVIQEVCNRDLPRLVIGTDTDGRFSEFLGSLTARFPARRPQSALEALRWFREVVAGMATLGDGGVR